jgi:hypothetical protein
MTATTVNPNAMYNLYAKTPGVFTASYFDLELANFINPEDINLTYCVEHFDKIKMGNECACVTLQNKEGKSLCFMLVYRHRYFEIDNVQRTYKDRGSEFISLDSIPQWCKDMVLQLGHYQLLTMSEDNANRISG